MSKRTREEKSSKPQQLAKLDAISIGRRFAQPYGKARLLIDHPHSYREWNIVGQCDVPGFFYIWACARTVFAVRSCRGSL